MTLFFVSFRPFSFPQVLLASRQGLNATGRTRGNRAGFTLIELLVAMVVSLILVVALLQIFNSATHTWQHGEAQFDAYREARGALQLMASDLSATLQASYAQPTSTPSASGSVPVAAAPLLPTLVLNRYVNFDATAQPNSQDERNNEEVYCLTNVSSPPAVASASPAASPGATPAATPNSLPGARQLCAVGYFCQWLPDVEPYKSNPARAPHAYGLMRQYLNGDGTFLRLKAAQQAAPNMPLSFLQVYTRSAVTLLPPTTTPPVDMARSALLAAYIWDLKFRISTNLTTTDTQYDNGEASSPPDPSSTTYIYSGNPPTSPLPPDLPPFIEIRFKAMSANAARRLEGNGSVQRSDWLPGATTAIHQTLIVPSAQQFVLRVPLINSSAPPPTPSPTP